MNSKFKKATTLTSQFRLVLNLVWAPGVALFLASCQTTLQPGQSRTGPAVVTAAPLTITLRVTPIGAGAGQLSINALKGAYLDMHVPIQAFEQQNGYSFSVDSPSALKFYSAQAADFPSQANQKLMVRIEPDSDPNETIAWGLQLVNVGSNGADHFRIALTVPNVNEQQFDVAANSEAILTYAKNGTLKLNAVQKKR